MPSCREVAALEGLLASDYAIQVGAPQVLERPFSASLGQDVDGLPAREGPHILWRENLCSQNAVPAALIKWFGDRACERHIFTTATIQPRRLISAVWIPGIDETQRPP